MDVATGVVDPVPLVDDSGVVPDTVLSVEPVEPSLVDDSIGFEVVDQLLVLPTLVELSVPEDVPIELAVVEAPLLPLVTVEPDVSVFPDVVPPVGAVSLVPLIVLPELPVSVVPTEEGREELAEEIVDPWLGVETELPVLPTVVEPVPVVPGMVLLVPPSVLLATVLAEVTPPVE